MTLNNADLTVSSTFEDLFYIAPQVINPQAYYKGEYILLVMVQMADFIINNGKLHERLLGAADMLGYGLQFNPAVPVIMNSALCGCPNGRNYLSTTTKRTFSEYQGEIWDEFGQYLFFY